MILLAMMIDAVDRYLNEWISVSFDRSSEYKVPLRDGAEQTPSSQADDYAQDPRYRLKHVAETDETEASVSPTPSARLI